MQEVSKFNHGHPYGRLVVVDLTQIQEITRSLANADGHHFKEGRNDSQPEPSEGMWPCTSLFSPRSVGPSAHQAVGEIKGWEGKPTSCQSSGTLVGSCLCFPHHKRGCLAVMSHLPVHGVVKRGQPRGSLGLKDGRF